MPRRRTLSWQALAAYAGIGGLAYWLLLRRRPGAAPVPAAPTYPTQPTPPTTAAPVSPTGGGLQAEMTAAVNAARARGGTCGGQAMPPSAPLRWNPRLAAAAERIARDNAARGTVSHTGADGSTMTTRIQATGYRYQTAGENVAAGDRTVADVIRGWLNSPGHCRNMLDGRFTEFGAARVEGRAPYGTYWAQVFARPAA